MGYVISNFDRRQVSINPIFFDKMIDDNNPVRVIGVFINIHEVEHNKPVPLCLVYTHFAIILKSLQR